MFPRLGLYSTDPEQTLITADVLYDLDGLDREQSNDSTLLAVRKGDARTEGAVSLML